jgi:hypothetical protein
VLWADRPLPPGAGRPYVRPMKIRFTKAPTFTKAIIAAAVFAIVYLASTSNLPSCSDTTAVLSSGGECIERQSFLHTASGWLALICLVAAVVLLALKHKDAILGWQASGQQARQEPSAQAQAQAQVQAPAPVPVPGRASGFCAKCGTRIIAGDRFCQGCGDPMGSP